MLKSKSFLARAVDDPPGPKRIISYIVNEFTASIRSQRSAMTTTPEIAIIGVGDRQVPNDPTVAQAQLYGAPGSAAAVAILSR